MKIKKIVVGVLTLCVVYSCENDNQISLSETTTYVQDSTTYVQDSPVVQKLLDLGYKKENIKETKEFYLVEGDIIYSKNINDYKKSETGRHASTNNLVSTQYRIATVYIHNSVSQPGVDDWSNAIVSAMNKWSALSGNSIGFARVYEPADITIKSDYGSLPTNVIAAAGFPSTNGKAYQNITINLDFYNNQTISESTKIYNMVHELGHCIGFRHTNWENEGLYDQYGNLIGANYIPNTPNQDPNSVMNSGTALYSWNGFSNYDVTAVNFLYPPLPCNTRLIGPNENSCAFDIHGDLMDYSIIAVGTKQTNTTTGSTWQISSNSINITGSSSSHCKVTVKPDNTIWPATGIVTKTSSSGCTTTYNVTLSNCNSTHSS